MNQVHQIFFITFSIFILGKYSKADSVKPVSFTFQVKDKQFLVTTEVQKSWLEANDYCNSKNLKLASITSGEENSGIIAQLHFHGITGSLWTSGNDIGIKNHYVWQSTGQNFTITNWALGQPDHIALGDQLQHCVIYESNDSGIYHWSDEWCTEALYIICNT